MLTSSSENCQWAIYKPILKISGPLFDVETFLIFCKVQHVHRDRSGEYSACSWRVYDLVNFSLIYGLSFVIFTTVSCILCQNKTNLLSEVTYRLPNYRKCCVQKRKQRNKASSTFAICYFVFQKISSSSLKEISLEKETSQAQALRTE